MRKAFRLTAIVLSMWTISYAQEPSKHPIDKALEACLDKNQSTAGMAECVGKAYDRWDEELKRVYDEMMSMLEPQGKAALKEAQRQWIKFRDSEFKFHDTVYSTDSRARHIPMSVDSRMRLMRNRALELRSFLNLLKGTR